MQEKTRELLIAWVEDRTATGWGCKTWEQFTEYYTKNEIETFISLAEFFVKELTEKSIFSLAETIAKLGTKPAIVQKLISDAEKETEEKHKEAIAFFQHLKNHPEVQNAPTNKGIPVCKICGKSSEEIIALELEERNGSTRKYVLDCGCVLETNDIKQSKMCRHGGKFLQGKDK